MITEKKRSRNRQHVAVLSVTGLIAFAFSLWKVPGWPTEWVNFLGVALLGVGGVFAVLAWLKVSPSWTTPAALACSLPGGCVAAGAALRAALGY